MTNHRWERHGSVVGLRRWVLLGIAVTLGSGWPALAQVVPESAYAALRWRLVGPFRGGRVLAVAGIPGDPTTFYFGSVGGGVWKTANAGLTWEPLFDHEPTASIGALAVAPSDPMVIYVGTGEAALRSDISFGTGVYKSTDGGAHWSHLGLDDTRHIGRILVDRRNPDVVLVAALGHAFGPNPERGVFRSTDGGRTWQNVLYKDAATGAIDLAVDPSDADVVYAALWRAHRPPWSQYPPDEGPGSGLYRSTDGGQTWAPIGGQGLPVGPLGRIGVAVARGPEGPRVYALVGARQGSGLYRSDDGGATWRLAGADPRITNRNWYFCRVTVDPRNPDVVYVPNVALLRSSDGGATFEAIKGAPGGDDYHELWIDPQAATRMIVGSDQGATVSLDAGRTWSSWYNQPTAQFYHVATDDQFPYRVYGAQQDAGTAATVSRSDYGEITFRDWQPVGAGESGYIAPDPLHPGIVYGGDAYGGAWRFDRTTGQSQDISPWPVSFFGQPMPERKYRFTWTSPLVFDRLDAHVLYLGAEVLLRTRDGGLHWEAISPDLTGARPAARSAAGPVTVANAAARGYGVIYSVAPSPLRGGVIWIGTDDGLIQLTTDAGQHWHDVTPAGLESWSKISVIEASPFDPGAAYAAVDRHRLDDFAPHLHRTRDYGRHWTPISEGIEPTAYVQVVRADPGRRGLLYAGTETGVYVSFDDGEHWQSLQLNLPPASVRDLVVHDHDLVAATHGRAFWILDDLTPLEQLGDSVVRSSAHLFRPKPVIRIRRSENHDTPLPPEEPRGTNPPAGAIIAYYLGTTPAGAVTLEIADARGTLVRRFASDAPEASPPEPPQFAQEWLPRATPLTRHPGVNRLVWDLRYPPPPTERHSYSIAAIAGQGTVAEPEGPLVLPGSYRITLTVREQSSVQPLRVELDPRVRVTRDALASQLRLALEVWNALAEQRTLHDAADALVRDLRGLAARDLDAETRSALGTLQQDAERLARAARSADLGGLETAVESADRAPTQQSREAFADLEGRLARTRRQWHELVARDLAALNVRLGQRGLAPLRAATERPERIELPPGTGGGR
jgi:photosystem II stability/assembly factor-like uncharacterized protein